MWLIIALVELIAISAKPKRNRTAKDAKPFREKSFGEIVNCTNAIKARTSLTVDNVRDSHVIS